MKWQTLPVAALAVLVFSSPLHAQSTRSRTDHRERELVYQAETELDFEEIGLEGRVRSPQGAYLINAPEMEFEPLIRLRMSFGGEMNQSVDQL